MTNIDEIVKALRYCASGDAVCPCKWAEDNPSAEHCEDRLFLHAADAIEALQSENLSLRAERDQARLDCAIAERNHMNITQIRARLSLAKENVKRDPWYVSTNVYIADVEELLAEVGRLTAKLERSSENG